MSLAEVRPDVPVHVSSVVARAMAKAASERFATMDEVIAAFEDVRGAFAPTMPRIPVSAPVVPTSPTVPDEVAGKAVQAPPSQVLPPPAPRRPRAVFASLGLAAVTLGMVGAWPS